MRVTTVSLLLATALYPASSWAGETPWQEVAPGVKVRLIGAGALSPDGSGQFALELDMPETTKTYWRVPGDTGFPLSLDFSQSKGVSGHRVDWPYPRRHEAGGNLDYAYFGHTILPVTVEVSDAKGLVDMQATIAVCSDICVPAQARFSLPITDPKPDQTNALRIRQALAEVPIAWAEPQTAIGAVELIPNAHAIVVELDDADIDPASLIAATADGAPLFGAPQKSPQGDLVVLPILGKSDDSALQGKDVELTFMTDMGAYVVNRTIESGSDMPEVAASR